MIKQCDLELIQNTQIHIMDDIHRICVEEGYRYYLIGGSALGAVRHKGIIPWDVDIDIAMPRKDYESFIIKGSKKLKQCYALHDYRTEKDFGTVHALVVLKDSVLLFKDDLINKNKKNRYGIFVDILPLDQFPEDEQLKNKQIKDLQWINTLRFFYQGSVSPGDCKTEKIIKSIIRGVLHCFFSIQKLNKWQQQIVQRYDSEDEGTTWCSMLSHYSIEKLTMPKDFFGTPKLMEFSGRHFFVPERTEDYLTQLFGDYMKLPSEKQRMQQVNSVYFASWNDENQQRIEILNP